MVDYRHCPVCGNLFSKKIPTHDERERLVCTHCSHIHYLNPKPTVKGVIFKENKILLVRRAEAPGIGGWDLPGGYLEWDEHPEFGLLREVTEETGVVAEIDGLIGAFHKVWKWDHVESSILNLAYKCRWVSGDPQLLSPHEIDDIHWATPGELPGWMAYGHFGEVMKKLSLPSETPKKK